MFVPENIVKIKEELTQVSGRLVPEYLKFDMDTALDFQARLLLLKEKVPGIRTGSIKLIQDVRHRCRVNNIGDEDVAEATARIKQRNEKGKGLGVPLIHTIAVRLGMLSQDDVNVILEAQACASLLKIAETLHRDELPHRVSLRGLVYEHSSFGWSHVDKESAHEQLAKAQAMWHVAEIYEALVRITGNYSMETHKSIIERFYSKGLDILEFTGDRIWEMMEGKSDEGQQKLLSLAAKIRDLAGYERGLGIEYSANQDVDIEAVIASQLAKKPDSYWQETHHVNADDILTLVNHRLQQAVGLKPRVEAQLDR